MGVSTNEAWIQNDSLFNGSKIYLRAEGINFSQTNLVTHKPITKVSVSVTGSETSIGDSDNYNRRKGYNSYDGFDALNISVSGVIDLYSFGSLNNDITITPGIIYTLLANGHRTYYFYDAKVVGYWLNDPTSGVQIPYNGSGIPVVLLNYNMDSPPTENTINYTLTLREDKDV